MLINTMIKKKINNHTDAQDYYKSSLHVFKYKTISNMSYLIINCQKFELNCLVKMKEKFYLTMNLFIIFCVVSSTAGTLNENNVGKLNNNE